MSKVIKKTPVPIAGLALALAATGNLVLSYGAIYRNIFGTISALLMILLTAKIFMDPKGTLESLKNPVVASVCPTFTMCLMLISNYIKPSLPNIAFGLWILGLILHCLLIIWFTMKFIFNFDIKKVFPSYFIVYVGIVVGSITAPAYNLIAVGKGLFWFGLIAYLCLLPIVIYRVFIIKTIPEPALPTITIFAAPASLCLAGYIGSFQEKNIAMIWFLGVLSLVMFLAVLLYLPKMLKSKFYPSFSAFTFPLVISGIAMKQTNGFLLKIEKPMAFLKYIIKFQEVLAVLIVLYALIKYFQFLFVKETISNSTTTGKTI